MPLRTLASSLVAALVLMIGAAPTADDAKSDLERHPEGWTDLLAGAGENLKGWTRVPIPPPPKGELREESPWKLDPRTGVLLCDGRGLHEWLRHDVELADCVYHVEWRFVPVTTGKKGYNSGIYVRNSADGAVWHQAQTGDASGGFIFAQTLVKGEPQRVSLQKDVKAKRVKPAGEWNTFEMTARGRNVSLWVNGGVTCEWDDCEVPKGFVGLEAEGYEIEFRNVKVRSLK